MKKTAGHRAAVVAAVGLSVGLAAGLTALPSPAGAVSPGLTNALKCRSQLARQGKTYAKKRLSLLLGCVDKLLKCEVLLEVDGDNPNTCRSRAIDSCTARVGAASDSALSRAAARFDDSVGLGCLPLGLTQMLDTTAGAGGLWFGNVPGCGGSLDIPTLVQCLRANIGAYADAIVSNTKPRAGLLLDNAGLGGQFPSIERPPEVDVTVTATSNGSGVIVSPGTINVPLGSAVQFVGDVSLSCGGSSNNGKLTITVGSGPTAQEMVLKEPYPASEIAVFGPYTASGTIPYTIELKDGSCMDTVSDNVSVP